MSAADHGASFRSVVSNASGTATSNAATLTVTANGPPSGTITLPAADTLHNAGDRINYAGTGTDPQDGTLPASAFAWTVVFHHDAHTHPFLPAASGATSGSFVIPTTGHTEANVWYRIHLTVTDSGGLTHTSFRDVPLRTVTLRVGASPPGLQVTLDGQPQATPTAVPSVVGVVRTLGVVSPQTMGGVTYEFVSWSDGGAVTHTIATPGTEASYTATFRVPSAAPSGRIVTGAGAGGGPHVRGFAGTGVPTAMSFLANPAGFAAGVRVATGDVNGDGVADVVTGAGPGGGPHVQVFDGATGAVIRSFLAYPAGFTGGVYVAAGRVTGDHQADIVPGGVRGRGVRGGRRRDRRRAR